MDLAKIVIVGAGQAGARAALAVRDCNATAAISLYGCEVHPPYERPELSKSLLWDPKSQIPHVLEEGVFAQKEIILRVGCEVVEIDRAARSVTLSDGTSAPYDRLLIATGSRLKTLAIEGVSQDEIYYLRTLDHCHRLEQRLREAPSVAVIGGGFIGLEVAASASRLGCRVTVVEAAERLLPRVGCPELSAIVAAHHRASGIDVRLGVGVVSGGGGQLRLSDGSAIEAAVIVAGIGIVPETTLAQAAGLEVDDGVIVDAHGQTSDPSIFAAGDVTRQYHPALGRSIRLESWQNANDQATAAGRSLAGCPSTSAEQPWVWSDQGELKIQMVGAPDAAERVVVRGDPYGPDGASLFQIAGDRVVGGITLNRGGDMAMIRRLLTEDELALPVENLADMQIPLRKFSSGRRAA